jgi:hypothetical protein
MHRKSIPDRASLLELYCELMEEVKRRRDIVVATRSNQFTLPKLAAFELCYLQLRLICELIALGCLAAHGDIPVTKGKLRSAYAPGAIFSELERLHPEFFPAPGEQILDTQGQIIGLRPVKNGALTKDELYQRHQSVTCSAHWRVAMDVMISGRSLSLFQASQHASTMSS